MKKTPPFEFHLAEANARVHHLAARIYKLLVRVKIVPGREDFWAWVARLVWLVAKRLECAHLLALWKVAWRTKAPASWRTPSGRTAHKVVPARGDLDRYCKITNLRYCLS